MCCGAVECISKVHRGGACVAGCVERQNVLCSGAECIVGAGCRWREQDAAGVSWVSGVWIARNVGGSITR